MDALMVERSFLNQSCAVRIPSPVVSTDCNKENAKRGQDWPVANILGSSLEIK